MGVCLRTGEDTPSSFAACVAPPPLSGTVPEAHRRRPDRRRDGMLASGMEGGMNQSFDALDALLDRLAAAA